MSHPTPWAPISSARSEIRLLDLAPKSSDPNELSCDLRVVSLDEKPSYEALSYVWGEKADPPDVLCVRGEQCEITRNLFEALHSLRSDDELRTLWVDALCIRQTDNEERSWQVSMMGEIYSNSTVVLAWLGSDDADLIRDIHIYASDAEKHFLEFPERLLHTRARESWWRRAWTLQEAVLGPSLTFCSGKERCSDTHFSEYLCRSWQHDYGSSCCRSLLNISSDKNSDLILLIQYLIQVFESRFNYLLDTKKNLLQIALNNRARAATDPRDRLFAFIGIACNQSVPPSLVQYGEPLLQIMIDTTSKFLQKTNTLEVIRHAASPLPGEDDLSDRHKHLQSMGITHSLPRLQNLPSWCVDWTQDIPEGILHSMRHNRGQMHGQFRTGMSHQANVTLYNDNCLGVTGIKCDKVLCVGDWAPSFFQRAVMEETMGQWCYMLADSLTNDDEQHKCSPSYFDSRPTENERETGNEISDGLLLGSSMETSKVPNDQAERTANVAFCSSGSSWEQLQNVEYPFTGGESLQDAFRQTLLGGLPVPRDWGNNCREILSAPEEMAAFAIQWCSGADGQPFSLRVSKSSKISQQAFDDALGRVTDDDRSKIRFRMRTILESRRMVVSQKGYIGISPAGTRVGDHMCVLHGGEMPFILRERSTDDSSGLAPETAEHYVLVGEAYVHGLMHGEAITAAHSGQLQRVHMVLH